MHLSHMIAFRVTQWVCQDRTESRAKRHLPKFIVLTVRSYAPLREHLKKSVLSSCKGKTAGSKGVYGRPCFETGALLLIFVPSLPQVW